MEAIYSEMDYSYKVKILKDKSDHKFEKFELEVIEIIQESKIVKISEIGEVFEVAANREYSQFKDWSLQKIGKDIDRTSPMACHVCNNDLQDCTCDDLEERFDSIDSFAYKKCGVCMKHYARCRCEIPSYFVSSGGKKTNIPIP